MDLGKFGIWTTFRAIAEDEAPAAARLVEELGYGVSGSAARRDCRACVRCWRRPRSWWSRRASSTSGPTIRPSSLPSTRRWHPTFRSGCSWASASATPRRRVTISRSRPCGSSSTVSTRPRNRCRASVAAFAALAPKMLALSAERSLGAIPYFVPVALRVARNSSARRAARPGGRLRARRRPRNGPGQGARVRAHHLGRATTRATCSRLGFTEGDIAAGGSDRLIDAVVPHGTADEFARAVRAHLEAGADHVAVQAIGEPGIPRRGWAVLAEAFPLAGEAPASCAESGTRERETG